MKQTNFRLKKNKFLVAICVLMSMTSFAQSKIHQTAIDYSKEPVWVKMMNDPKANFFETVKAFREFWRERELPKEPFENEEMDTFEKEVGLAKEGESEKEREREREHSKKKNKTEINYTAEVRAFKGWYYGIQAWVREDGSIISAEEQQKIIDMQRNELKQVENKSNKR